MTFTDPFSNPGGGSGDKFDANALSGSLLMVEPTSLETGINTKFGDNRDAVKATVTVLDGPSSGTVLVDTLIFPGALIGQLKFKLGEKVLGRLGKGTAKAGMSAPWKLQDATAEDRKVGIAYINARPVTPAPFAGVSENPPW